MLATMLTIILMMVAIVAMPLALALHGGIATTLRSRAQNQPVGRQLKGIKVPGAPRPRIAQSLSARKTARA
jgi:hypothetical protein